MQVAFNKETENKILAFTKYAQFISEKFGITVRFDGLKAETDGSTITLPNLLGMSQREIDFLYCVLLHEVGHIKYTPFTKETFAQLKTQAHFALANAIEDARIENCLMDEYDGAHKVFDELYNKFANDKAFMKKIFGFSPDKVDEFKALTTYLHYELINLDKKMSLKEIMGPKLTKKVENFVVDNNINAILKKHPLNEWTDSIKLANKIYDLFFKTKKDNSEANFMPDFMEALEECMNEDLKSLQSKIQKQSEKISELNAKSKDLREKLDSLKTEKKSEIESLEKQIETLEKQQEKLYDYQNNLEKFQEKNQKVNNFQEKQKTKEDLLKELEGKVQDLAKQVEEQLDPEKKSKLEQKLKNAQENLKKQSEIKNNYQEKISNHTKQSDELKKEVDKLAPEFSSMTKEQMEAKEKELEETLQKLEEKLHQAKQDIYKKEDDLRQTNEELRQNKADLNAKLTKDLRSLQEKLDKAGIPCEILPAFEGTPGWESADEVQQSFDEQASNASGDIVTNGCGFGKGSRDIMTLVEKAQKDLQEIDVAKIFKERNNVSLLDELNDFSQINKTSQSLDDGEVFTSTRKHIPLTTRFDKVTPKTMSSGSELAKIRKDHAVTIKKAKEIFRLKMKSHKKDKFKGGQEEGQLDARNLWKLATKTDNNYYEVNQPRHINNVAASIVVDVSGSMDKDYTEHGQKLRELTVIISDALQDSYVKHEICGYHAPVNHEMREIEKSPAYNRTSNILETIVYKQFNDKNNSGIQNLEINCTDNCDGESLKLIGSRLIRERAKRRVMFVITDGKPFLSDADIDVLDQDLKNTLLWCYQNKIEVYALSFNEHGRAFYGDRFCYIKSYEDFLNFCMKKLGCS